MERLKQAKFLYLLDTAMYSLRTYVNTFLKVRSLEFNHLFQKHQIYQLFLCFSIFLYQFVISLKANEGLLREHVSQTCCHPNDDKLVLSPPLSSQSSPDLDVMHVL